MTLILAKMKIKSFWQPLRSNLWGSQMLMWREVELVSGVYHFKILPCPFTAWAVQLPAQWGVVRKKECWDPIYVMVIQPLIFGWAEKDFSDKIASVNHKKRPSRPSNKKIGDLMYCLNPGEISAVCEQCSQPANNQFALTKGVLFWAFHFNAIIL